MASGYGPDGHPYAGETIGRAALEPGGYQAHQVRSVACDLGLVSHSHSWLCSGRHQGKWFKTWAAAPSSVAWRGRTRHLHSCTQPKHFRWNGAYSRTSSKFNESELVSPSRFDHLSAWFFNIKLFGGEY
jgi:hypothetical protein